MFVLDSSGSIREANPDDGSYDNWNLALSFVISVVNRLDVGTDRTRVGVVSFSQTAVSNIYLNDFTTSAALTNAVRQIPYLDSHTNTSGGIREMHYNQFTPENGDRVDVPNIAIVISDGQSTVDEERTIPEAEAARNSGIAIYVFGISDSISEDELRAISSSPQERDRNYYLAPDFRLLNQPAFLSNFATEVCLLPANQGAVEKLCIGVKVDLVFILDVSGTTGSGNVTAMSEHYRIIDFAVAVVDQLEIGPTSARVGVVTVSSTAQNIWY